MLYLNVGNNKSIREKDIIGIFDLDTSSVSSITRKYLSTAEKNGDIEGLLEEIPKSFVLYSSQKKSENRIVFSQFSSSALHGRTEI